MYNPPLLPNISPTVYKPPQKGLCHNISPGLNYGILRYRSLLKLNDFITKFVNDLTVIWYFLKSIISIWDTLKSTHFFCLITSSDQLLLLCTSLSEVHNSIYLSIIIYLSIYLSIYNIKIVYNIYIMKYVIIYNKYIYNIYIHIYIYIYIYI